jgi:DNA-binding IclR family transcriptional regulator
MKKSKRNEGGSDLAENRRGIQSVEVGIPLLLALQRAPGPLTLTALSESASMTASKAHRYLASYVRAGLVRQNPTTREYELGPTALSLGLAALSQLDLVSLAGEAARTFAESSGHTTLMCVWSERGAVIVRWIRGLRPVVTSLALGSALPALSSATGQVFLANLPRTATAEAVRLEQRSRQRMKIASLSELQIDELISRVRRQGAAWVDGGYIPGLRAFSCPILDYQGEAAAAITLISSTEHVADPKHPAAHALVEACKKVNEQAGSFVLSGPRHR